VRELSTEVLKQLESGSSLSEIARALTPPAERELLRRCALALSFDERLFDEVLRQDVPEGDRDSVTFERVISNESVEHLPRTKGHYQVREEVRQQYLKTWWDEAGEDFCSGRVPPALRALSDRLVTFYEDLRAEGDLDRLYHLIAVDREEAKALFLRLARAADEKFDLARCTDLINILRSRRHILGPALSGLLDSYALYFKARSLWINEYHQSANYFERLGLTKSFKTLLRDDPKWIMHLNAPCGMGKSIYLRWLIARRCVPEPYRIPCVLIDFEDAQLNDPVRFAQEPWTFTLRLAEQLDEQIERRPFYELLPDLRERSRRADHLAPSRRSAWDDFNRFADALLESKVDRNILVIFDSLDAALAHPGADVMVLVEHLALLRGRYPRLRLILSGRDGAAQKIAGFTKRFNRNTLQVKVGLFRPEEAHGYLKRRLKPQTPLRPDEPQRHGPFKESVVEAVIRKAEGHPLKLAVYADLIEADPQIRPSDIIETDDPDLALLIRKVVDRIGDRRARWLFRYGVVLRELSLPIIKDVLAPHLKGAWRGRTEDDDPNAGLPPRLRDDARYEMPRPETDDNEFDFEAAWEALGEYAGGFWVCAGEQPDILVFPPEVLRPMRRALQRSGVFRRLNRSAAEYFNDLAQCDVRHWCRWAREAVYHTFQFMGAAAGDYWRALLSDARAAFNPQCRLELARELMGPDYLDERGQPLEWFGGGKIIDPATLAQAHFESAAAISEIGLASPVFGPRSQLWKEMSFEFTRAEALMREEPAAAAAVHPARVALLLSKIHAAEGREGDALKVVEQALKRDPELRDRLHLMVARGDLLARRSRYDEAADLFNATLAAASLMYGVPPHYKIHIHRRAAENHMRAGSYVKAMGELRRALRVARWHKDAVAELQLRRHLAETHQSAGRFEKALTFTCPTAEAKSAEEAPREFIEQCRLRLTRGKIFLSLRDPLQALEECSAVLGMESALDSETVRGAFVTSELTQLNALARELHGSILSDLMEYPGAINELDSARSRYTEAGDSEGAFRCLLLMIVIQLRLVGDLKEAAVLLDQAEGLIDRTDGEVALRLQMLRADWLYRDSDRREEARQVVLNLVERSSQELWQPRMVVIVALEALAQYGLPPLLSYVEPLSDALLRLHPPTARINFPKLLRRCPGLGEAGAGVKEVFHPLLPAGGRAHSPSILLNLAEVYRIFGDEQLAGELLVAGLRRFARRGTRFPLALAIQSLNKMKPTEAVPTLYEEGRDEFLLAYKDYHTLCAALHVYAAQYFLKVGDDQAAERELDHATNQLLARRQKMLTRWDAIIEVHRFEIARKREDPEAAERHNWRAQSHLLKLLGDSLFSKEIRDQKLGAPTALTTEPTRESAGPPPESDDIFRDHIGEDAVAAIQKVREAAYVAQLSEGGGHRLVVNTFSSRGRKELPAERFDALAADPQGPEPLPYTYLKSFLGDYRVVSREMWRRVLRGADSLFEGDWHGRTSDLDVRLEIEGERLAALPWEFTVPPVKDAKPLSVSDNVRFFYRSLPDGEPELNEVLLPELSDAIWVQRTLQIIMPEKAERLGLLADGNYGPVTTALVKEFQRDQNRKGLDLCIDGVVGPLTKKWMKRRRYQLEGKVGPQVLLLRAGPERELDALRAERAQGIDPAELYANAGVGVTVIDNPTPEHLAGALSMQAPDLIHMCGTMKVSSSMGTYLDFTGRGVKAPSGESTDGSGVFSIPALSNQLKLLNGRGELRPILVFDILQPSGISEMLRQYFIRNTFASEFYRLGLTPAIIGMGLGSGEQQSKLYETFMHDIAEWRGVGTIVKRMRAVGDPGLLAGSVVRSAPEAHRRLERLLPTVGTVLLTQNPFY
jgi:tetratricopeptide (TPR) repeat protein/peptidoglycan hydrolase-like protein with peptidoglycan-binding domain